MPRASSRPTPPPAALVPALDLIAELIADRVMKPARTRLTAEARARLAVRLNRPSTSAGGVA